MEKVKGLSRIYDGSNRGESMERTKRALVPA